MHKPFAFGLALILAAVVSSSALAEGLDPKVQAKVDALIKDIQVWSSDSAIVEGVRQANANPSAEAKAMTQEKWKALTLMDPYVRGLAKNAAAQSLRTRKTDVISEAFVSAADGTKVAFLGKTTGWSHKGKAKHDDPMSGKTWQGAIEVDESTGVQQVQVGVPVRDGDKVVGSLVVGINLTKLKD